MEKGWTVLGLLLFLSCLPAALADPTSYITENVQASFFPNGSLDGSISRTGMIEVSVGNTRDVLQYIILNVTQTDGTNLQSLLTYKNVAGSPTSPGDRTPMFMNTTDNPQDIRYRITNTSLTPVINIRLEYSHLGTGRDLNGTSLLSFNFVMNLNYTQQLPNSQMIFQTALDSFGINDSMNISAVGSTSGNANLFDSDSDGFFDRVEWAGNLQPGVNTNVTFTGLIIPGVNYNETYLFVNTESGETAASNTDSTSTYTGMTFSDRFSRGPIRQGIEMFQQGNWMVRGFLRNIADLTYIVNGWSLYRITGMAFNPLVSNTVFITLQPGNSTYTDIYNSGVGEKQFYAAEFDWEVRWTPQAVTVGTTQSSLTMPTLYQIDAWTDKTINILSNTGSSRSVFIDDEITHIGHSRLNVNSAAINSTFAHRAASGVTTAWSVSDVHVYYVNGSGQYEITSGATVISVDATAISDGFVYAYIGDLSSLGHVIKQNDKFRLTYTLSGPSYNTNLNYDLNAVSTLWTASGTPITLSGPYFVFLEGVAPGEPPGGGGGGGGGSPGPAPSLYADIVKIEDSIYFVESDLVNITVLDQIIDTGDKGVRDVNIFIFVPGGLDTSRTNIMLYDASSGKWNNWVRGVDYTIESRGSSFIGDNAFVEYHINRLVDDPLDTGLILNNGDLIEINYITKIPFGTSYLLTRVSGVNYYDDKIMFEDVYNLVRREGELEPLDITEGEWLQEKAYVNTPVLWKKYFDVYNQNEVGVENLIATDVFDDVLSVYLKDVNGDMSKLSLNKKDTTFVEWNVKLRAGERKRYILEATTPPVIEVSKETDVLHFNDTSATFAINSTITNFALEAYTNISYLFNVKPKNIRSINDYMHNLLVEHENGTEILVPSMDAGESLNVSMIYVETPPILITFLDKDEYERNETGVFTILVVPSENEYKPYLEVEITGPDDNLQTVYADIIETGVVEGQQEVKMRRYLNFGSLRSGNYTINTKYNRDFDTILTDQKKFVIKDPDLLAILLPYILFIVLAVLLVVFILFTRYTRKTYQQEMKELRKEIKKL